MNCKGMILSIEKTSVHDGPGLRTSVFLKGCPLHCLWCHNPESQSFSPELYYFDEKCVRCAACVNVCKACCHAISGQEHAIDRSRCNGCKACVAGCPYSALEMKGEEVEVEAVLREVEKDRAYYEASGGGLTVSGGEPLSQYEFTYNLLAKSKKRGLHNCIETCGHVPTDKIVKIKDYVDLFLYDYKESDAERHKQYTGVDNILILKNLRELDALGARSILRCPVIPGLNDREEHFLAIAELANSLKHLIEVNIMPYHSFGKSKSKNIGREYPLEEVKTVEKPRADRWIELVRSNTRVPVKKG